MYLGRLPSAHDSSLKTVRREPCICDSGDPDAVLVATRVFWGSFQKSAQPGHVLVVTRNWD